MDGRDSEPLCKRKKYLKAEMSTNVLLGLWTTENFEQIQLANVDLGGKVETFKQQALKIIGENNLDVEFMYCGIILENNNTLTSYGINPGEIIHIIEKPKAKPPCTETKWSETEIVNTFRNVTLCPDYRTIFQRLARKEIVDKIIQAVPDLEDDPAALALIQDPELLMYFAHKETVEKLVKVHPVLALAAKHIAANIKEAQTNVNPSNAGTSSGYSYSLDALSDDDESESNTEIQFPLTRNTSFNAITAAQLAAAIANATNTQFNMNGAGVPSTPTTSNVITNEMFSSAIQQAFALGNNPGTNSAQDEESFEVASNRWRQQLQQMHEMGLVNDVVNVRALRATDGDVNAAVQLVFRLNEN